MEPANEKKNLSVRTVADVEVGKVASPPTSPATEQDRAEFQKLLKQMKDVSLLAKEGQGPTSSSSSGKVSAKEAVKPVEKLEQGLLNEQDKQASQKKKKKRGGKKSNKPSPTDSPQKTSNLQGSEPPPPVALVAAKKEVSQLSVQQNENEAQSSTASRGMPYVKAPNPPAKPSKAPKSSLQNTKIMKKAVQDLPKVGSNENQTTQSKYRESVGKPTSKDLQEANSVDGNIKPSKLGGLSLNGESELSDPFAKQPLMLLRAGVNLIRPKKKIQSLRDLNLFYCLPCDREFPDLDKHLEKSRDHMFRWKCEMRERTIDLLPDLSTRHVSLLDDLVTSTVDKCKMPDDQYEQAHSLWISLDTLAKSKFKDCSVRWFGSHSNRIALAGNKMLNMDLLVQSKEDAAVTFLRFISAVEENFPDVERVVATNFAHANIYHNELVVQLSLNNNGAFHTSKLIRDYISIDKRVQPLSIFFRHWGQMCEVDQGENGSWQGHAFPLMVIHFLQQKLVLPVLHEMVENPDGNPEIYLDPENLSGRWSSQNKDSVGQLLFQMFSYYAVEHDVEKHVVSVTQKKPYLRSNTKWNAKRIAVVDPFQPKHNISRYISANMYDYVHFCLVSTACALGIPRCSSGPLFGYIGPRPEASLFEQTPSVLHEYLEVSEKVYDLVLRVDNSYNLPDLRKDNDKMVPELRDRLRNSAVFKELLTPLKVMPQVPENNLPSSQPKNAYVCWWVTPFQAVKLTNQVNQDSLIVQFSKYLCTDNEELPITCTSCHKSGHLRVNCPDEIIPKMSSVAPPSPELNAILNQLCHTIFETRCSEDSGLRDRIEVCKDILHFLRQFYQDVDLHLFGSSMNGFGGRSSDIDMCLTFQSNANGEGLNFPNIVEEIQQYLRGHKGVYQLLAITTAKVPIVKFVYGRNRIQVDISLYNRLGIMNTKLLHAYSVLDPRVRPLVYMMKCLAKTTGIGDASRGSLSSYAYSLMSLYFLQQVEPPVIPVLQELVDPTVGRREEIVDGANVYFFRNLDKLDEVWPHRGKNQSSLGQLWLQLLEFYASDKFHNSQRVVCIRLKTPLYKFDKLWTSTNICIEDPFDLNHNLGSGLSKRMNIFIVKTFQKACRHFSSLPRADKQIPLEKYYFNETALSVGKPPSDRGCHFCRSIGHVQMDCPKRLMLQQRAHAAPRGPPGLQGGGRPNRGNAGRPHPNHNAFENANRGGRREPVRDNHPRSRDPGRISNMPMPMNMPGPVPTVHPGLQNIPKQVNPQSPLKPIQGHVVVGSMKPPGYPSVPPGFPLLGAPVRMIHPQMAPVHPQYMAGPAPPFVMPRPPMRPAQWQ